MLEKNLKGKLKETNSEHFKMKLEEVSKNGTEVIPKIATAE
jgi:hypothetical protein